MAARARKPPFERINVRRLVEPKGWETFEKRLQETRLDVENELEALHIQADRWTVAGELVDHDTRTELADMGAAAVTRWLKQAAVGAAGLTSFFGGEIRSDLLTSFITRIRKERDEAAETARRAVVEGRPRREVAELWAAKKLADRMYRRAVQRQKKRLFNRANDERVWEPAAEAKRIACARARAERKGCALPREGMDDYVRYFRTTMGAAPGGTQQPDAETLRVTDPGARRRIGSRASVTRVLGPQEQRGRG